MPCQAGGNFVFRVKLAVAVLTNPNRYERRVAMVNTAPLIVTLIHSTFAPDAVWVASVDTSNPAIGGQGKTGQRSGTLEPGCL